MQSIPEYQELLKSNPNLAQMMKDPNYLRSIFSPENIRLMRQLEGFGIHPTSTGLGGMGNMSSNPFSRTEQLSSEQIRQRYSTQIAQIEEMGFVVDDNVLQTLHRFHGNVDATIDFLINYDCLFSIFSLLNRKWIVYQSF